MYKGINRLIENAVKENREAENAIEEMVSIKILQKDLENHIKAIKDRVDKYADDIADAEGRGANEYHGYEIKYVSGAKRWNFKEIPDWAEVDANRKLIELKYKSMFDAIQKGNPNANITEDGEELPLPELKYNKGSVQIKKLK